MGKEPIKQAARGASQNRSEALALGPRGVASRAAGRGRKAGRLEGAALAVEGRRKRHSLGAGAWDLEGELDEMDGR